MKKKITNGLKKAGLAVSLAIGPILVTFGYGQTGDGYIYIVIIGILCMCGSVIFWFLAIKEILSAFFDETNE